MTPEDLDALIRSKQKSGVALLRTPQKTDEGIPGCWLGGEPTLPPEIEWPVFNPKTLTEEDVDDIDIPMHFFAQLNLAEMPSVPGLPQMPRTGTLFVFFDPVVAFGPEGDALGALSSGEGARLIYVAGNVSEVAPRTPPAFPDTDLIPEYLISHAYQETFEDADPEADQHGILPKWPFAYHVIETWPCCTDDPQIDGYSQDTVTEFFTQLDAVKDAQFERLDALLGEDRFLGSDGEVNLQSLFGATQRDRWPELEFDSPEKSQETDGAVLLLTLASDGGINHHFWDDHHWGIWVHRNDLTAGNFDDISIVQEL
jgi:uncharacterized protein YwqG